MTLMIEREVKLRFASPEDAREAILAAGATPLRSRRLQEDALLDTEDESLRRRRCVLRIRTDRADYVGGGTPNARFVAVRIPAISYVPRT